MVNCFNDFVKKKFLIRTLYLCLSSVIFIALVVLVHTELNRRDYRRVTDPQDSYCYKYDNLKCLNGGFLEYNEENKSMACSCPRDYFGEHCQKAKPVSFMSWISSWFQLKNSDVSRGGSNMWWSFLPFTSELQVVTVYSFHQNVLKRLETVFSGVGKDAYAARMLPRARPLNFCPKDKTLPQPNILYHDIFARRPGQFKPDPKNRNLLFDAFYQYFVLQFFNAGSNMTVTASQLYGSDAESERALRSFSGGKLKTLIFNGEHYATHSALSVLRSNVYLKGFVESMSTKSTSVLNYGSWLFGKITRKPKPVESEHESNTSPMLYAMSTLWVREHNRVCDMLLSSVSSKWTDEDIYVMARRIVTGQMMTIMMNEIMKVNTGRPLKLRPELNHDQVRTISGAAMPIELVLTMAVSSVPEQFESNGHINSAFFGDSRRVSEDGLKTTLKSMVNQAMGKATAHNDGETTEPLTKFLMKLSREHSVQGFNNYRRLFGLPAYKDFYELTGDSKTAVELNNLYKTVDDVELLTGMLTERTIDGTLPTVTVMTNSFIINAILSNRLTSKFLWKRNTFGGKNFFNLVKSANLKSLVCRNLHGNCEGLKVGLFAK